MILTLWVELSRKLDTSHNCPSAIQKCVGHTTDANGVKKGYSLVSLYVAVEDSIATTVTPTKLTKRDVSTITFLRFGQEVSTSVWY